MKVMTGGWFPRSAKLRRARWQHAEGEIDAAALHAVEAEETQAAVRRQLDAGVDLLSDGQLDRADLVGSYVESFSGLEADGLVRCFGNRYYRPPRIVGKPARREPTSVRGWQAARAVTDREVCPQVTGPYTLMDWSFDEHFDSREDCCEALADLLAEDVAALVAAGATTIRIEEPALAERPDDFDLASRAFEPLLDASKDADVWLSLGLAVRPEVFRAACALPVHGIAVDGVNAGFAVARHLEALPEHKHVALGVLDVFDPTVESVETVRARIALVADRLPVERIWLAPDAGLHALSPEVAGRKLERLRESLS